MVIYPVSYWWWYCKINRQNWREDTFRRIRTFSLLPVWQIYIYVRQSCFNCQYEKNHASTNSYYCSCEWHTLKDNTSVLYKLFCRPYNFLFTRDSPSGSYHVSVTNGQVMTLLMTSPHPSLMVMQRNGSKCFCLHRRPNTSADSPHTTQLPWQAGMAAGIWLTRSRGPVTISCHVIIMLIIIKHDGSQANSLSKAVMHPFLLSMPIVITIPLPHTTITSLPPPPQFP